ncbi:MAG: Gfo/Idh/MocA family oxidoreductase [Phycisphaerales bacterium]|jgi:predicted dehydrogenase|nr:Gfo/Idh/MocA family oxidoreductase [Phycisphaerales bacterium]
MSNNNVTRRGFMQTTAAAAAAASVVAGGIGQQQEATAAPASGKKLRFAMIGCGGRAGAHYGWAGKEQIVAVCDPDKNRLKGKAKGDIKGYTDYRELFKEMGDKIDAVVVATPDHNHFPAAMRALKLGKAVYCEKPLVWSFWEGQQLAAEAKKQKVATQMGNQGMGGGGWRQCHAIITGGAIGDVKEVHTWTNRPVWPQGIGRPEGEDDAVKDGIDWNSWIGPAPLRPYKKGVYHSFKWRGWLDFGAGALGDMACHTMNAMFKILEPGYPTEVELMASTKANKETYPASETIRWSFPKTDKRPAFTAFWYDGPGSDKAVPIPSAYEKGRKLPRTGTMFVGTKGVLQVTGDYNNTPMLIPESARKAFGKPKQTVAPSNGGHMGEFIKAAKGEIAWDAPFSNFQYAGPMTSVIILGIISQRVAAKLTFCPETLKFTGSKCAEANALLRRVERDGWEA